MIDTDKRTRSLILFLLVVTTLTAAHAQKHENYNTTYLTPGLKLKLLPGSFISPYLAGGLGWGGFRSSNSSATSNQFAQDIGGGADCNLLPILSWRGEVRDYYTCSPRLDVQSVFHGNVNNVVISDGVMFRF